MRSNQKTQRKLLIKKVKRTRVKRSRVKRTRVKRSRVKRSRVKRSRVKRSRVKRSRKKIYLQRVRQLGGTAEVEPSGYDIAYFSMSSEDAQCQLNHLENKDEVNCWYNDDAPDTQNKLKLESIVNTPNDHNDHNDHNDWFPTSFLNTEVDYRFVKPNKKKYIFIVLRSIEYDMDKKDYIFTFNNRHHKLKDNYNLEGEDIAAQKIINGPPTYASNYEDEDDASMEASERGGGNKEGTHKLRDNGGIKESTQLDNKGWPLSIYRHFHALRSPHFKLSFNELKNIKQRKRFSNKESNNNFKLKTVNGYKLLLVYYYNKDSLKYILIIRISDPIDKIIKEVLRQPHSNKLTLGDLLVRMFSLKHTDY